jgi:steroid delta-isomerase-like uncharacterized protein
LYPTDGFQVSPQVKVLYWYSANTHKLFKKLSMTIAKYLLQAIAFIYLILFWMLVSTSCEQTNVQRTSNEEIASSYITEVINKRKLEMIPEIYSPNYVFHGLDGIKRQTIQDSSLISFLNYLFRAFPDLQYTIDHAVTEKDIVSLNLTGSATHKDEFLGFPASNKKITFKEMFFFRVLNGKIIEGWGVVDLDGVKTQISKE